MLATGQPLHAFDLDALGDEIVVRRARAGERLTTLDDVERTLDVEDLLITDESDGRSRVLALAGVMGGASSEVARRTTNLLVESAHFDPITVARTARRHKLPTEAGRRYERGVDTDLADRAAELAVRLLTELGGGSGSSGITDVDERVPRPALLMPVDLPTRLVGVTYSRDAGRAGAGGRRLRRLARRDRGCGRRRRRPRGPAGRGAVVAPGPGAGRGPGRGGRPGARLRAHPLGAAAGAGRSWADPLAAAAPVGGAFAGRARAGRGAHLPVHVGGAARRARAAGGRRPSAGAAAGEPAERAGAPAAHQRAGHAAGRRPPQPLARPARRRPVRGRSGLPPERRAGHRAAPGRWSTSGRRRARRAGRRGAGPAVAGRRAAGRPARAGRLVGAGAGRGLGGRRGRGAGPGRRRWGCRRCG